MESSLFRYLWLHSKREQLAILVLVLASFPFYFLALNLPKEIVNGPIMGQGFETPEATATFLDIALPVPGFLEQWLGSEVILFAGVELGRFGFLLALCLAFLLLIFVNGMFKYNINTFKGRMGERLLRRLRFELVDRVLRFPPRYMKRIRPSEIATMIKDEVEPLGGFIGEAIVQPVFLGGQAATALIFIMLQNVWLGLIAASVVLLQAYVIPKLRIPILILGKQRQLAARDLAGRIGEIVDGADEIHTNDTSHYERAEISQRLGHIFGIRYEIFQRKFFVKFLNNFLSHTTSFLFYLVGGYFAIKGQLDIGQLVAAIAAYKDLPPPIKELIDWDQRRLDVQIKYEQVIDQFHPDGLIDPASQDPETAAPVPLEGDLRIAGLTVRDEAGRTVIDSLSASFSLDEQIAVAGEEGSGKDMLALVLARLVEPLAGKIVVGGRNLLELPETVTGRRFAYVGPNVYLTGGSVRDNLLYGLKHRAPRVPVPPGPAPLRLMAGGDADAYWQETLAAGNSPYDPNADWLAYGETGSATEGDLDQLDRAIDDVLETVELDDDIYRLGLSGSVDPDADPDLALRILAARNTLQARLAEPEFAALVEPFDPDRYNRNASIAENLMFGTPLDETFAGRAIAFHPYIDEVIRAAGIEDDLLGMGLEIAEMMVEIFADLPRDHPFFDQYSFISADDLPDYEALCNRISKPTADLMSAEDRGRLLRLPFGYVEARHRLGFMTPELESRLIAARKLFASMLPPDLSQAVEFYRPDRFNAAASIQDNILFGRIAYGQAEGPERIGALIDEVVDSLELRPAIKQAGLEYHVGTGGQRLSTIQRQKIGLARALLRNPSLIIVNQALAILDARTQNRIIRRVLAARAGGKPGCRGVFWVLVRPEAGEAFERLFYLSGGKLVRQGSYGEVFGQASGVKRGLAGERIGA